MSFAESDQQWLSVIGRSLALMSMQAADMSNKTTAEKAAFLEALGISRKDVALMLGTSYASITELHRQAKNRKTGKAKSKKGR